MPKMTDEEIRRARDIWYRRSITPLWPENIDIFDGEGTLPPEESARLATISRKQMERLKKEDDND